MSCGKDQPELLPPVEATAYTTQLITLVF